MRLISPRRWQFSRIAIAATAALCGLALSVTGVPALAATGDDYPMPDGAENPMEATSFSVAVTTFKEDNGTYSLWLYDNMQALEDTKEYELEEGEERPLFGPLMMSSIAENYNATPAEIKLQPDVEYVSSQLRSPANTEAFLTPKAGSTDTLIWQPDYRAATFPTDRSRIGPEYRGATILNLNELDSYR